MLQQHLLLHWLLPINIYIYIYDIFSIVNKTILYRLLIEKTVIFCNFLNILKIRVRQDE